LTAQSTLEGKDAEAFFRLFSSLDAYVNSRLQLVDGCRTPAEVRSSNRASLHKVREALWTNLDLLTRFIALPEGGHHPPLDVRTDERLLGRRNH